jgi:hypothetical protein
MSSPTPPNILVQENTNNRTNNNSSNNSTPSPYSTSNSSAISYSSTYSTASIDSNAPNSTTPNEKGAYGYNVTLSNGVPSVQSPPNWIGDKIALNPHMSFDYREISFDEIKMDDVAIGR